MNKPTILIIGASGSGKTTSLRNLPQDKTCFIDTECKGFPYLIEKRKYIYINKSNEISAAMDEAEKSPIRVIDSFTELSHKINVECNKLYTNYDIYKNVGLKIALFLDSIKSTASVSIVVAVADLIEDMTESGTNCKVVRATVHGKQWEGKIESKFLIVLHLVVERDIKTGENRHLFRTTSTARSPAKAPMFLKLPEFIPNDINIVLDAMKNQGMIEI